MKFFLAGILIYVTLDVSGQYNWTWEELAPMPEAISNNAVTHGLVGEDIYVFTFSGIDTTKTNEGISLNSMRYSMNDGQWEYIEDLPDTLGKIAAAASTVDNLIYIIGGYHVFDGAPYELSSDRVHRYDPVSNSYLEDGTILPFAIDDQVQAVWRDSLIYVVTGWSNTQNVEYVQIYDPSLDEWQLGTPVPNGTAYEAFGASGTIVGDTIYYYGGAVGFSFNSTGRLRKGVIDPDDPTQITWSDLGMSPGLKGYRSASLTVDDRAFWIGGSSTTYNYNGIAYNGSGGVDPLQRILGYDPSGSGWSDQLNQPFGIMDLRGSAQVAENQFVICGGMEADQIVTDRAFLLTYGGVSSLTARDEVDFDIFPNPVSMGGSFILNSIRPYAFEVVVLNNELQILSEITIRPGKNQLNVGKLCIRAAGIYHLRPKDSESTISLLVR